ncbi:unnamed protein product [Phytophthora lilii]|uniref:Unnamed protein product n=1 Tax=Phytophthora lilii TaxID=2077276 RepID=A0A9W6X122_9STRA|nr:unnamed protein product [Phytophthora lilii]
MEGGERGMPSDPDGMVASVGSVTGKGYVPVTALSGKQETAGKKSSLNSKDSETPNVLAGNGNPPSADKSPIKTQDSKKSSDENGSWFTNWWKSGSLKKYSSPKTPCPDPASAATSSKHFASATKSGRYLREEAVTL